MKSHSLIVLFFIVACSAPADQREDASVQEEPTVSADTLTSIKPEQESPGFTQEVSAKKELAFGDGYIIRYTEPEGYLPLSESEISALKARAGANIEQVSPEVFGFSKDARTRIMVVTEFAGLMQNESARKNKIQTSQQELLNGYNGLNMAFDYTKSSTKVAGRDFEVMNFTLFADQAKTQPALYQKFYLGIIGNYLLTITVNYTQIVDQVVMNSVIKNLEVVKE